MHVQLPALGATDGGQVKSVVLLQTVLNTYCIKAVLRASFVASKTFSSHFIFKIVDTKNNTKVVMELKP